ncbi:MAG: hypothetical protein PHY28_10635, partial [Dehalococcoidales bacterium]|nr:hypothetical protein [Dehalococcoidales bacterium]
MLYEERYTNVTFNNLKNYLKLCDNKMVPDIEASGGKVLCVLTGLIGDFNDTVLQITGFPDFAAWQASQAGITEGRSELVEKEEVRLLRSVSSRPKAVIPPEDRRPVYGINKIFISP